jgi:hypothetical protein
MPGRLFEVSHIEQGSIAFGTTASTSPGATSQPNIRRTARLDGLPLQIANSVRREIA